MIKLKTGTSVIHIQYDAGKNYRLYKKDGKSLVKADLRRKGDDLYLIDKETFEVIVIEGVYANEAQLLGNGITIETAGAVYDASQLLSFISVDIIASIGAASEIVLVEAATSTSSVPMITGGLSKYLAGLTMKQLLVIAGAIVGGGAVVVNVTNSSDLPKKSSEMLAAEATGRLILAAQAEVAEAQQILAQAVAGLSEILTTTQVAATETAQKNLITAIVALSEMQPRLNGCQSGTKCGCDRGGFAFGHRDDQPNK